MRQLAGDLWDDEWLIAMLQTEAVEAIPYCPYSMYPVIAAVAVRKQGMVAFYHGANYEVVSFNQTMHAEHSAITAALNDRTTQGVHIIEAVYVETKDGGSPCGHCRQIINEFASMPNIPIYIGNAKTGNVRTTHLGTLLPDAFDVSSLA